MKHATAQDEGVPTKLFNCRLASKDPNPVLNPLNPIINNHQKSISTIGFVVKSSSLFPGFLRARLAGVSADSIHSPGIAGPQHVQTGSGAAELAPGKLPKDGRF